jgi:hypothetical protein
LYPDLDITSTDYKLEVIEGGSREKSKEKYKKLIAQSIKEMYRVLKFDRWLSFVFAHKDPDFWHLIIDTAEKCSFEYVGAVPQKNGYGFFTNASILLRCYRDSSFSISAKQEIPVHCSKAFSTMTLMIL